MKRQRMAKKKKSKKQQEEEVAAEASSSDDNAGDNLSDEEVDFGSDFEMDLSGGEESGQTAFNEEDVEFSDDGEHLLIT